MVSSRTAGAAWHARLKEEGEAGPVAVQRVGEQPQTPELRITKLSGAVFHKPLSHIMSGALLDLISQKKY